MDKTEYCAVIKFFVKEDVMPNEIHSKFTKAYGESSSFSTIKKWAAAIKHGRTSLEYDPREGRPESATTSEIIEKIHDLVLDDRRIKVREIGETLGISIKRICYVLHEELHMKYYSNLLTKLDKKIREKRPSLEKIKVIFHHDNAPAYKSVLAMGKLRDLRYELLEQSPYSLDLAPSDFHLFPKLKHFLAGERFSSNEEVVAAVQGYFVDLPENYYRNGIMALEHRWNKCSNLKRDYVEK